MVDHAELLRPLYLNAWGYDDGDMGMVEESLAEDAVLIFVPDELVEDAEALGGERRTVGRQAILDQMSASRVDFGARGERPVHAITNVLVERASETEADVRCFYLFGVNSGAGLDIRGMSRYYDHLVNDGSGWRIQTRRNTVAHAGSRRR